MTEFSTLEALAERAQSGDAAALSSLARALLGPVYRVCLRVLGSHADAEDATQEIVVIAITKLGQFESRGRMMAWVYRIAFRHLMRFRRSKAERAGRNVQEIGAAIEMGLAVTRPDSTPTGDVVVLGREVQLACTQGMLMVLSRDERLAYVLGGVLGATDVTGAEVFGISRDAFRKRLSRARAKMRPVLEDRCGLVDATRPCRCVRQAAAMQKFRGGVKSIRGPGSTIEGLAEANAALGQLLAAGKAFDHEHPDAPATTWQRLQASFPELIG